MSTYRSEQLAAEHDLQAFDSGAEELDKWLRGAARHADAARTGRTFVWVAPDSAAVVGYFTLAAHLVRRAEGAEKHWPRLAGGHPGDPACPFGTRPVPARWRVRRSAPARCPGACGGCLGRVAARLVVVDAVDAQAAAFYLRYGFRRCPHPQRLVRKTSDIAAALRHS